MKFAIIYKDKHTEFENVDTMSTVSQEQLTNAFMVVAQERVITPEEPYMAVKTKNNQVIVCYVTGAEKVDADSIFVALNGSAQSSTMSMTRDYTISFVDNEGFARRLPNAKTVKSGEVFKASDISFVVYSKDETKEFNGWLLNGQPFNQVLVDDNIELVASWKEVVMPATNSEE